LEKKKMATKEDIKVLVVDDSPYIHILMTSLLRKEGIAHVFHALNGDDGLRTFIEAQPDIVFLDIIMPKTTGLEVLEELRKLNKECIVVMITSLASEKALDEAKDLGANYYLIKPFLPEKIHYVLERFLNLNLIPATV
jgi:CheY-like chemotaxis protein